MHSEIPYEGKICFLDVETPNRQSNTVCEVSLDLYNQGKLVKSVTQLINPLTYFDNLNISMHHITPQDVADSQDFESFYEENKDCFAKDVILAGHNICCDLRIMQKDLSRNDITIPIARILDTQDPVKKYLYDGNPPKGGMVLEQICNAMNIPIQAHQAKSDCEACIDIMDKLGREHDFKWEDFIKDAESNKSKRRKELEARVRSMEEGTVLVHRQLGKVKLVSVYDEMITVANDSCLATLPFPESFFKHTLWIPKTETDKSGSD